MTGGNTMTNWDDMIIRDIAKKYSCEAVIDYDKHSIFINGEEELAIMAFSEIEVTLKLELY